MSFFHKDNLKVANLPGDIVRTVLVTGPDLTVARFDINGNGVIPEHVHPHVQTSSVLKGKAIYRIGEEAVTLEAGDSCYIPSNVPHSVEPIEVPMVAIDTFTPGREDF